MALNLEQKSGSKMKMVLYINVFDPDQKGSCTNHTENRGNGQRIAVRNLLNTVSVAHGDSVEKLYLSG